MVQVVAAWGNAEVRVQEDLVEFVEEVVFLGEDAAVRGDVESQDELLVQRHRRSGEDDDHQRGSDVDDPLVLLGGPQRNAPDDPPQGDQGQDRVDHEFEADVVARVDAPRGEEASHGSGEREHALVSRHSEVAVDGHLLAIALEDFVMRVSRGLFRDFRGDRVGASLCGPCRWHRWHRRWCVGLQPRTWRTKAQHAKRTRAKTKKRRKNMSGSLSWVSSVVGVVCRGCCPSPVSSVVGVVRRRCRPSSVFRCRCLCQLAVVLVALVRAVASSPPPLFLLFSSSPHLLFRRFRRFRRRCRRLQPLRLYPSTESPSSVVASLRRCVVRRPSFVVRRSSFVVRRCVVRRSSFVVRRCPSFLPLPLPEPIDLWALTVND